MFAFGETVQVVSAGSRVDPYSGESVEDWSAASERSVDGVGVAPAGSVEPLQDARNQLEADFDLYLPADDPVARTDRVRVRGDLCDVVGRPFLWRNPFTGWTPGLVVRVKLREG